MFSSLSSFSLPFGVPRFLGKRTAGVIDLKSVEIHDVQTSVEKRARALKHLIKLNHINNAILFNDEQFHNHVPHLLGSAYLVGASTEHLSKVYDHESISLVPWKDSPNEISKHDWRDYLGDRRYERAYVDFFEDELVLKGYDWRKVVEECLFSGEKPVGKCLISGLGHPLVHLGYAYEFSSPEIAMEALGIAATSYDFLHKYLDDFHDIKPTKNASSPLDILQRVRTDKRLDDLFIVPGEENVSKVLEQREDVVMEHLNAWDFSDPKKQFEHSQYAAAAILVATNKTGNQAYDFFFMHILSTSHAVRILLPLIPAEFHMALVRQWWFLTLVVYIAQLRPDIDIEHLKEYDLKDRDWTWVYKQARDGEHALDPHYVKALRALKEAASTWGDSEEFYLRAAVRFGGEFDHWSGYGRGPSMH